MADQQQPQQLHDVRSAAHTYLHTQLSPGLRDISLSIYNRPEPAFHEHFASTLVRAYLAAIPGIAVSNSKAHLQVPTAFVATFQHLVDTEPSTTIAFCSEYDALPMGHACGHNLICISGIGAFLTTAYLMRQYSIPGNLVLFGTPGEETLGGKINMIHAGDFDDVDFAMMLHPGNVDLAYPTYLAVQGFDVQYHGRAAHASGAPWEGINALDAVILAYNSVSQLRQQILPTDRVHGIITNGGVAPNIIPASAQGSFMCRSTHLQHLQSDLLPRVMACMTASAKATGCTFHYTNNPTYYDVNVNMCMSGIYATELSTQLGIQLPPVHEQRKISRGSTDMGNVTHKVPGIHNVFDIGCKAEIHSVDFMQHAKTEEAHVKTLDRVGCLVMVAYQLLTSADLRDRATLEFKNSSFV